MIAVAGASGFIGRALCDALTLRGKRILRIGRRPDSDLRWPDRSVDFGATELAMIGRCRAIVNFTGATIGARWTAGRKRAIRESRGGLTGLLARGIAARSPRPSVLLSASAVGIYGDCGDAWIDETAPLGSDFLASVARDWEAATAPASAAGVRVVHMRLGVVIGPGGGMIGRLQLPFRLGLGARLGAGSQWMSWIALEDVVAFVLRAIDDDALVGEFNLTSPEPVTNRQFTDLLATQFGRPARLAAPAFALRLAFGEMAQAMLLASQRVRPARLLAHGFAYSNPNAESALRAALRGAAV